MPQRRLGISVSGLANAWPYVFSQPLARLNDDGLRVLVIPFEWVPRPSVQARREFFADPQWAANVCRRVDATFDTVLTTCSIIIDNVR